MASFGGVQRAAAQPGVGTVWPVPGIAIASPMPTTASGDPQSCPSLMVMPKRARPSMLKPERSHCVCNGGVPSSLAFLQSAAVKEVATVSFPDAKISRSDMP